MEIDSLVVLAGLLAEVHVGVYRYGDVESVPAARFQLPYKEVRLEARRFSVDCLQFADFSLGQQIAVDEVGHQRALLVKRIGLAKRVDRCNRRSVSSFHCTIRSAFPSLCTPGRVFVATLLNFGDEAMRPQRHAKPCFLRVWVSGRGVGIGRTSRSNPFRLGLAQFLSPPPFVPSPARRRSAVPSSQTRALQPR